MLFGAFGNDSQYPEAHWKGKYYQINPERFLCSFGVIRYGGYVITWSTKNLPKKKVSLKKHQRKKIFFL